MRTSHILLLVVSSVVGGPPKPWDVAGENRELPDEDQCRRKEFTDKGKVTDLLNTLGPTSDMQSVLDILGNSVTQAIRLCSKKYIKIDDIDIQSGYTYICGSSGHVYNLYSLFAKSWKYLGENIPDKDSKKPLEFKISFKYLGGVSVEYYNCYVRLPLPLNVQGKLFIEIQDFDIDLTFVTDSLQMLMEKFQKQECFLHIKRFGATFGGIGHSMRSVNHPASYEYKKNVINSMVMTKKTQIMEDLKLKVKWSFYDGLVNSGRWICMEEDIKELIDKQLYSTRQTGSSKNFNKYCKY